MLTNHFRRFLVLGMVLGLVTAVLSVVTAMDTPPPGLPLTPDERALLPHLPPEEEAGDRGSSMLGVGMPRWSKGVFQSLRDNNWEIYRSDYNVPNLVRLTTHAAPDIHPRLNRGATRIVFASGRDGDYEIFVMNADGTGLQQLTFNGTSDVNPIWSPDGSRIAFQAYRDGQAEIYVMNANGSNQQRLTFHGNYDGEPNWSPDGNRIAFTSARTGIPYIYVMNSNGTGVTKLSNQTSFYPVWSPDGGRIAYSGDQDGDNWLELWLMNADGSNQHMAIDPYDQQDAWARGWSPDGRNVLYTDIAFIYFQGNWYWLNAYIMAYDTVYGDNYSYLLDSNDLNWHPDWQTTDVLPPQSELEVIAPFSQIPGFGVNWSGEDQDTGAGVAAYDVQYQVGPSGPWVDWQMGVTTTAALYTAVPATTVSFRARAHDNAFNTGNWSPTNNATTTFYTWPLAGQLSDNRGSAISQAALSVNPLPLGAAQTDNAGNFLLRLKTEGSHTFDVTRAGYGDLAQTSVNMENLAHVYLPPANNAFLNGGFEAAQPLSSWTTTGAVTAVTNPRHTGSRSALLGSAACTFPCLTAGETITESNNTADMTADSQGNVHFVLNLDSIYGLFHLSLSPSGTWSEQLIAQDGYSPKLTIDREDRLHAVWTGANGLYYAHKSPGNSPWSTPVLIFTHNDPVNYSFAFARDVAIDRQGGLHVLVELSSTYLDHYLSYYLHRRPDGVWQNPIPLQKALNLHHYLNGLMAVGPDDTLHFIWGRWNYNNWPHINSLYHQVRYADGTWSNWQSLPIADNGNPPTLEDIAISAAGTVHLMWSRFLPSYLTGSYHQMRSPNGQWSAPTLILERDSHSGYVPGKIAVDSKGGIHAALWGYTTAYNDFYYAFSQTGSSWQSQTLEGNDPYWGSLLLNVDQQDIVHILANGYYRSLPATANSTASLSQPVTIPANIHAPTLAFMARRPGDLPGDSSGLELLVDDGVTITAVPLATGSADWKLYWADMSAWAGQTVTIIFRLTQVSGEPRVQAAIDDVTLGSAYPDTWINGSGPAAAVPGQTVVYHLNYGNRGGVAAADGLVTINWPTTLTFVSANITPTIGSNTITWNLGELEAQAAPAGLVVTATVVAAAPFLQSINLPAAITSATAELEQQNNQVVIPLWIAHQQFLPVLNKP